jgi:hypothetical protein
MIYTCYDMIRDCRSGAAEGWSHFITDYVPVMRRLAAHYGPGQDWRIEGIVSGIRSTPERLFASVEPSPERWFVAELRQRLIAELEFAEPQIQLDLETVAAALEPLTLTEKQAAWLQTMRYSAEETASMLRMSPKTVEKVLERSAELIRGRADAWRRDLLAENGPTLGQAAGTPAGEACPPAKTFLDILDGRTTWTGREQMERHVNGCWHCVDHFCRMAEVIEVTRGITPLSDAEAAPFRKLLGIESRKRKGWKRWFGGASG